MGLVQSNMNGDASDNEFLKSLPAVEVFSYQCSPLSTSQGPLSPSPISWLWNIIYITS
jgi:hypothetical protein